MRCDQCKNWRKDFQGDLDPQELDVQRIGFGECTALRERWLITDEAVKGMAYEPANDSPFQTARRTALLSARAFVGDGSQLFTAPDFFCAVFVNV